LLRDLRRFWADESGPDLVEWVVVTVILILAIYAILQALGPEIEKLLEMVGLQ
jgi:Flp pilus assembly pilin Flp